VLNSVLYLVAVFSPAKADDDEDDEEAAKVPTVDPPHSRFVYFYFSMCLFSIFDEGAPRPAGLAAGPS
jgi:hypothetical protein